MAPAVSYHGGNHTQMTLGTIPLSIPKAQIAQGKLNDNPACFRKAKPTTCVDESTDQDYQTMFWRRQGKSYNALEVFLHSFVV
ncbi:predicted protein [Uncinocarpus reesii 1704]|uniref:Uncharacterized protein n=1 Tax=Uncinocarpus reesii (strain UAMH 1704) TaxID=336963 RepID=C4JGW3_UNCRE|nr:uncharacterized protein UREG_01214 [Uncinocarpus reesii 1704]EEP76365.1 predicted protein [Uncinocarpus reesii 1704]